MEDLAVRELIQEIQNENQSEQGYLRKQLNMMRVLMVGMAAVVCLLVVTLVVLVPEILNTLANANQALTEIKVVAQNANEVFGSVQVLVEQSGQGVTEAIEKMNAIDIESLNQSIEDLGTVVSPLSDFFSRFR